MPELRFAERTRSRTPLQVASPLDMSRPFLPEALAGLAPIRVLDAPDQRRLNQIRACSYLHLFDLLETSLCTVARARSRGPGSDDTAAALAPLVRADCFDHHPLFLSFEDAFGREFPAKAQLVPLAAPLTRALTEATPLALLVLALHFKLVTQQHYLACVRGDENLEPQFVRVLKEHWVVECSAARSCSSPLGLQQALGAAPPSSIPEALRDYRGLVFAIDDVLQQQAELDVRTLEVARGAALAASPRDAVVSAQVAAHRKTFLTIGIVNAAFVYAMRALGPSAPSQLAGIVAALCSR